MKSDLAAWAETFETNVSSQFFVAAGFLPLLAKSHDSIPGHSPSIVNVTSISGKYLDSNVSYSGVLRRRTQAMLAR